MTNQLRFKITSVDHDGYNGRDFHPGDSDIGLVVTPVKMDVVFYERTDRGIESSPVLNEAGWVYGPAVPFLADPSRTADGDGEGLETCWTCVTPDGRVLELMEHELEEVRR